MSGLNAQNGRDPGQPEWSEQYCLSSWCRAERWLVRPDVRGRDLWLVAESAESAPWTVASHEPICPICGEALAAHVEGVGDIEAEPPATVINFLRALDRAA